MLKNRFMVAFAFVGLLGLAACGGEDSAEVVEEPVVEEPATAPVTEPAPITTDTMAAPTTDTAAGTTTDTTAH